MTYTIAQAAQRLGLSPFDIGDMIFDGQLKRATEGAIWRIPESEVRRIAQELDAVEAVVQQCIGLAVKKGAMEEVGLGRNGRMTFQFKRRHSSS
jgi:hypothetical protein